MKFDHKYIAKEVENILKKHKKIYEYDAKNKGKKFAIILPPPNITGHLHLGHAWDIALQDAIIRYKHLQGFNTLWIAGFDHASIATQTKFEKILKEETKKTRFDFPKKVFLQKLKIWANTQKSFIEKQWQKMNLALSLQSQCYTMDQHVNKAVNAIFYELYKQGLIYQDLKLVNWDMKLQTAISDIEINYQKVTTKMYYLKYYLAKTKKYLIVATTRPETLFGDVCLVINPNDKKNAKYIGKMVINPINKKIIPIIGDKYVDQEFGTGIMKCTPGHDFNDYLIGKKYKLPILSVFNFNGTLNEKAIDFTGRNYNSIPIEQARKIVVELLKTNNFLEKIQTITTNIGFSERSSTIVEPMLSKQWFVKMKPLVKKVIALQKTTNKIIFYPKRFNNVLLTWLNNIEDWCISRQLWWGHQIPVWYHKKNKQKYVGIKPPQNTNLWKQDDDVLDTWFSSGLWPMVCTFWRKEKIYKNFYPTNCLVTGYDILFFWIARMIVMAIYHKKIKPFNQCLIHGLIRDEKGRKMSKSLGNGIDPISVVEQYGSDCLKLFLTSSTTLGEDLNFSPQKIKYYSNVLNKIWNSYQLIKDHTLKIKNFNLEKTSEIDRWMLNEVKNLQKNVIAFFNKYEFTVANKMIINSFWNIYCNKYLEMIKFYLNDPKYTKQQKLNSLFIFNEYLKIFYPIAPMLSDYLYYDINQKIIWNDRMKILQLNLKYEKNLIEKYVDIFIRLKDYRMKNSIKKERIINFDYLTPTEFDKNKMNNLLKQHNFFLCNFVKKLDPNKIVIKIDNDLIILNKINKHKTNQQIKKYLTFLDNEIKRCLALLNNKNFLLKAPKEKVELEQRKLKKYLEQKNNMNQ